MLRNFAARGRSLAAQQTVHAVQTAGRACNSKELSRACVFFKHELRGRDVARSALRPLVSLPHVDGLLALMLQIVLLLSVIFCQA